MFPTRLKLVAAFVLLAMCSASNAAIVRNLYTATVDVDSQTDSERKSVTPTALADVLVKVTGRADVHTDPTFSSMMSRSSRYVEQFRYVSAGRGEDRKLRLRFEFDRRLIDRDLQSNNIAIWGAERPRSLAVVVAKTANRRELIGSNSESEVALQIRESMKRAAAARGLQLLFPLLDLEDQQKLPVNEVWTGITGDYSSLRSRYAVDSVLIGRLNLRTKEMPEPMMVPGRGEAIVEPLTVYEGKGSWEAWSGGISGQQWLNPESRDLDEIFNFGVGQLASRYSQLYAIGGNPVAQVDRTVDLSSGDLRLVVEGVNSYRDYQAVLKHVESRAVVESVSVMQLDVKNLLLSVKLKGSAAQLDQAFVLGRLLSPVRRYEKIQATTDLEGNWVPPPLPPFPGAKYYAFGG
jgi:hypothetical protein